MGWDPWFGLNQAKLIEFLHVNNLLTSELKFPVFAQDTRNTSFLIESRLSSMQVCIKLT